jgi:prepilin-type N-terminal cleavage/methylation domain-containing protein
MSCPLIEHFSPNRAGRTQPGRSAKRVALGDLSRYRAAFTLIELLVVVAIIAILSAVAVPNFLEAQLRSKVSRARSDLRTIALAIEAYAVDANAFPPGFGTAPIDGLLALTTPISYISNAYPFDPFRPPGLMPSKSAYAYELMNANNKVVEKGGGAYSVDPANPGAEPAKGTWWWVISRGPNNTFGFRPGEAEYDLRERCYSGTTHPAALMDTVYDPTNGTLSSGNLNRVGGSAGGVHSTILSQ